VEGIARIARHLEPQHAITAAVAAGSAALGAAGGGSSETAFSVATLAVWSAVLVALAAGVLPRDEPPQGALFAGACVAGLAALIALSLGWASDDQTAYEDVVRALLYLGMFVLVVIASKRGEAGAWLRGLAGGLTIIVLLALATRFEPGLLGDADAEIALRLPSGRLSYPIGYWNGLAIVAALACIALVWLAARARTRLGGAVAAGTIPLAILAIYASTSRGGFVALAIGFVSLIALGPRRVLLLAAAVLGAAGGLVLIVLANSRSAFLDQPQTPLAESQGTEMLVLSAAVVAVVALASLALSRPLESFRPSRRLALGVSGAAALLAVATLVVLDVNVNPIDRWEEFKEFPTVDESPRPGGVEGLIRGSSSGRYQFWSAAYDAFRSEPLRGIGSGDYEAWWNVHGSLPTMVRSAHSLFLESLAELGIAGGILPVGFFGVVGFVASRRIGMLGGPAHGEVGALLALLIAGAFAASIEWIWNLPAVFGPVLVAGALLTGPATLPARAPRVAPPMTFIRTRRRFAGGVAMLLVAWIAICAAGLLLLSARSIERANQALFLDEPREAITRAAEARDLQPWAADPHETLALAYRSMGELSAAQLEAAEAIERAPQNWRLDLLAAELDFSANDVAGAKANVKQDLELAPIFAEATRDFRDRLLGPGS